MMNSADSAVFKMAELITNVLKLVSFIKRNIF